ncbi:GGDEF domain-containing protein [Actinoplanes sp. NEAU-A12]|uniref:GGDEF domain-containing protein n=1 Tax=Actinoplanes sandaracinus TaxID=3045177 RepID=A0ABT6WCI0_9ACTN|nr:GGDEF domain-containing protein [Actinoplanes sandaracinus]MDI6097438.1 GGDEF domain-containing protein [Actinoplanes sandaracinus]
MLRSGSIRQDPLVAVALAWTLLGATLLFLLDGRADAQVNVFWAFQPPLDALLAYSSWRISRIATGPIRRFWRMLTVAGILFTVGDTIQTAVSFVQPGQWSTHGGAAQSIGFVIGLGLIVVAMLIHPHAGRSGTERLAFWLDSATVLVGGAVVAWGFAINTEDSETNLIGALAGAAVVLTAAFAAVKMILSGNAPMHRHAAVTMIMAAIANAVGVFAAPDADGPLPAHVYALRLLPSLLVALGPRIQEIIAGFDETPFGARRRKPYSLLPYGSIAVVFIALIVLLRQSENRDARLWGTVGGLGVIVVLVVARQLLAFHDNKRLIAQLDTTLTELREHETRLRRQALFDDLTGLANRTHFREEVDASMAGAPPGTVSVLLIDLDGFKAVNDTLGHAAGDALLAGVAEKMRGAVRSGDLPARLGGDEFAVLLRDCDARDAERTAQRILQAMTVPIMIDGAPVRASASIGVASTEEDDDLRSLLHAADTAMYAAKHEGKGTWMRYDHSMLPA